MFSRLARPVSRQGIINEIHANSLFRLAKRNYVRGQQVPRLQDTYYKPKVKVPEIATYEKNLEWIKDEAEGYSKLALEKRDKEGLISHWGTIPFIGMVFSIAVSKEILMPNEEIVVFCAFWSSMVGNYLLVAPYYYDATLDIMAHKKTAKDLELQHHIEKMKVYRAQVATDVDTPVVLAEMLSQQREAQKVFLTAQNLEERHLYQQAFLEKLNNIKAKEDAEAALERAALIDNAVANVYAAFKTDDGPLGEAALENAISLLGTDGTSTFEADPVKKLFVAEFE